MHNPKRRAWLQKELRRISLKWVGRTAALRSARVETIIGRYLNGNIKKKILYRCAGCAESFDRTEIHVDHRIPIGSFQTWDLYIDRLFCPASNLQCLCQKCHALKTASEAGNRR